MRASGTARRALFALSGVTLALGAVTASAQDYESASVPQLSALIPESLVRSGQHRIVGARAAGPYRLAFDIETDTGRTIEATTLAMATQRVHEIQTLAQAVRQYEADTQAPPDDDRGQILVTGDSFGDILGRPLNTSGQVVTQFGRNVNQTVEEFGSFPDGPPSSSRLTSRVPSNDPILASHRRNIARQLDLDLYSSNPQVQDFLETTARARMNGLARAGITTVTRVRDREVQVDDGKLRARVRAAMLEDTLQSVYEQSAQRLTESDVPEPIARDFLDHPVMTATHKTAMAEYVHYMDGVADRGALVASTLDVRDEVDAVERIQVARMFAHYHESLSEIRRFVASGRLPLALSDDGSLVVALPFDVLYWDAAAERVFDVLARMVSGKEELRSGVVLLPGIVTERAREGLAERGFQVFEGFLFRF